MTQMQEFSNEQDAHLMLNCCSLLSDAELYCMIESARRTWQESRSTLWVSTRSSQGCCIVLTDWEQQRLRGLQALMELLCSEQEYTALLNVRDSFWQERLTGAIGLDREPSGLLFLALSEPTKPLRRFFAVRMLMCMAKTHSEVSRPAYFALHICRVIQSPLLGCMLICYKALLYGPSSGGQQAEVSWC